MFNPEKYVTRAEAAEISYRMTQTPQALAFHNALYRQQVEQKNIQCHQPRPSLWSRLHTI